MGNQENAAKDKGRSHVSRKPLDDGRQEISNDQKENEPDVQVEDQVRNGKAAGNSDDDDESENVYEVERVVGHKRERNVVSYHLKWKGYPDTDNTWEKEKSVFCKDLVADYWDRYTKAGGSRMDSKGKEPKHPATKSNGEGSAPLSSKRSARPSVPASKKKGRDEEDVPTPSSKKQKTGPQSPQPKRTQAQDRADQSGKENDPPLNEDATEARKDGEGDGSKHDGDEDMEERENWEPPKTWANWDEYMEVVQTVERSSLGMTVHVTWKNGKESEVPLQEAHKKCPQKLIAFYEQHLKFTPA
ncbi:MAG: hypothetical protein J3Q66DRAFT_436680 [Benniella sp.]|nr:MAG: hypothetical protein J3Q66DRAFT_436680 [Benniella sp.]